MVDLGPAGARLPRPAAAPQPAQAHRTGPGRRRPPLCLGPLGRHRPARSLAGEALGRRRGCTRRRGARLAAHGCEAAASCLAEISRAAAADLLVTGTVGKVGTETTLSLVLIDSERAYWEAILHDHERREMDRSQHAAQNAKHKR